jgi:hypothetical protein
LLDNEEHVDAGKGDRADSGNQGSL